MLGSQCQEARISSERGACREASALGSRAIAGSRKIDIPWRFFSPPNTPTHAQHVTQ